MKKYKKAVVFFMILLMICGCENAKTIEQQAAEQMELGERFLLEQKYEGEMKRRRWKRYIKEL
ncbi:MAG: hypothetical protein HFG73_03160 [Hungatella sp.]|nr:hypothetical protein [Hungatella sp.]